MVIEYVMLLVPCFAVFAMTVQLGLWSNAILLGQIVLSGLVAFGFYQPLAIKLDEATGGSYTYFIDILAIWAVYCGTMLILKVLDQALSKTRMKFHEKVDQFGGPAVGLIAGWLMSGIVMASVHTAPVPPEVFETPPGEIATKSRLTSPDLFWLDIVETVMKPESLGTGDAKKWTGGGGFTENFVATYQQRRKTYAEEKNFLVRRN